MALNEDDHRLFVVTRRPPLVIVLIRIPQRGCESPVGGSADDVYFDVERKRIYVLGGEGFYQRDPTD